VVNYALLPDIEFVVMVTNFHQEGRIFNVRHHDWADTSIYWSTSMWSLSDDATPTMSTMQGLLSKTFSNFKGGLSLRRIVRVSDFDINAVVFCTRMMSRYAIAVLRDLFPFADDGRSSIPIEFKKIITFPFIWLL